MEYNLKLHMSRVIAIDTFDTIQIGEFIGTAVFLWLVLEKTSEESMITTTDRHTNSISELSFCLN